MMAGNNLEEIRLVIEHVKQKKVEGTLYLMSERMAWIAKQKETIAISLPYVDIKAQKISNEGKAKVQLQVVMHDDTSTIFHFVAPGGAHQQLKDRDQVKNMLATLLPKFKQKIMSELEEKKRILVKNPSIYQLYCDLVVKQLISADDFWKNYVDFENLRKEPANEVGVSQGFMAHINPKTDSSNTLQYNLNFDDIQSIFKCYPTVKQKYLQSVPHKMTETEFWTKFFQSYYFRRDQINLTSNDLFSDCSAKDEEDIKAKIEATLIGPAAIMDSQKDLSSEDGFGLAVFSSNKASNLSNKNLIKRYNYYSMRVLDSMDESAHGTNGAVQLPSESVHAKIQALLDEEIKDLKKSETSAGELRGASLNLSHIDRYFHGPSNEAKLFSAAITTQHENIEGLYRKTLENLANWELNVEKLNGSAYSIGVMAELSPGSQLMQSEGARNFNDEIGKDRRDEIKVLYVSSCEMLRHFWACFPPKNAELEEKLRLMKDSLESFYQQKVISLRDQLLAEKYPYNMTAHLESMFKIAFQKYTTWKTQQFT